MADSPALSKPPEIAAPPILAPSPIMAGKVNSDSESPSPEQSSDE